MKKIERGRWIARVDYKVKKDIEVCDTCGLHSMEVCHRETYPTYSVERLGWCKHWRLRKE
jgi:hypothetical protein